MFRKRSMSKRAVDQVEGVDGNTMSLSREIIVLDFGDETNNPSDNVETNFSGNCKFNIL